MGRKKKSEDEAPGEDRQRGPRDQAVSGMPEGYAGFLADLKQRIGRERVRAVRAANSAMVMLYWEIGRSILVSQEKEGWGTKVVDRLSQDLRRAFPEMRGLSTRNLKLMRQFASAWSDKAIVQRCVAQLPWRTNLALLQKLADPDLRLWYAERALEQGLSRDVLVAQIQSRLHERQGQAQHNFAATMPRPRRHRPRRARDLRRTHARSEGMLWPHGHPIPLSLGAVTQFEKGPVPKPGLKRDTREARGGRTAIHVHRCAC